MRYSKSALEAMKVKDLLVIAKDMGIVGRHDMKKETLIVHILDKQAQSGPVVKETKQPKSVETDLAHGVKEEWDSESLDNGGVVRLPKAKDEYIDNAKKGTIIAFKVNESRVLSGMIEAVTSNGFEVRTKNGVKFTVRRKNIIWVKTGARWPKGVYMALRGETLDGKCEKAN